MHAIYEKKLRPSNEPFCLLKLPTTTKTTAAAANNM